jgi:hypothetical protein
MENRKHPRFPVQFHSSFRSANIVSGEGNLVEVKAGTALQVRVQVSPDESPIHIAEAVVRWCRASSFGLEFVTLSPDEWARLQRVVKELEMQPYQRDSTEQSAARSR